jgi:hypothetical protein
MKVVIPPLKGHFSWFLVSNIFCYPLFPHHPMYRCRWCLLPFWYVIRLLKHVLHTFFNKNPLVGFVLGLTKALLCSDLLTKMITVGENSYRLGRAVSPIESFLFRYARTHIYSDPVPFCLIFASEVCFTCCALVFPPCIYSIAYSQGFCNRQISRNTQKVFVY